MVLQQEVVPGTALANEAAKRGKIGAFVEGIVPPCNSSLPLFNMNGH
jgi:hypothetical protein